MTDYPDKDKRDNPQQQHPSPGQQKQQGTDDVSRKQPGQHDSDVDNNEQQQQERDRQRRAS